MGFVIKIIGAIFILISVVYLFKPAVMKWLVEFFCKGGRLYIAGLLRLVLAIVFLLGARECALPWVIGIIGGMFIISSLLIFVLGPKKFIPILQRFRDWPDLTIRIIAVVPMIFGAIIIYAA